MPTSTPRSWNTPAQMFDHELNPVKGWPSPYAVDKVMELASGELYCFAGRCLYIDNTTQKFKVGNTCSATVMTMPIWAFPNASDFDVLSDTGNAAGGHVVGLVGNGGYELETTEYTGTGFDSNVALSVNNTGANAGKVQAAALNAGNTVGIVGVVSDAGPLTNEFKKLYVRFWPVYLPVRA